MELAIGAVKQNDHQSSKARTESTKSVNSTGKSALEKTDSIQGLSEAAFKAMRDDPKYREKVLSLIQRDLGDSYAPRNCSVLITVGATLNEYRADSWPVGHDSEFDIRSKNSFYKRTGDKKEEKKELLEAYLKKRAQVKKQQQELLEEKIVKQEVESDQLAKTWSNERRMVKASNAYEVSNPRESFMDRIEHMVVRSAMSFSDMRAGILKEVREEKGRYDYFDVVNACGLSYAKLYSEIEQRHEKEQEQYYKADGTLLTKEEEIEWLDMQYEQEVAWQKSCARIAAQGQVFQGHIPEIPTKEIEELEDSFYQAKGIYIKLYRESRQSGRPLVLQNHMFGNSRMYERLNGLGNLMR